MFKAASGFYLIVVWLIIATRTSSQNVNGIIGKSFLNYLAFLIIKII